MLDKSPRRWRYGFVCMNTCTNETGGVGSLHPSKNLLRKCGGNFWIEFELDE